MRVHTQMAILLLAAIMPGSGAAVAHDATAHHGAPAACDTTALACASVATGAFGPDGKLWVTWIAGGRVSVGSSADLGKTFADQVTLPKTDLPLDEGPDARPKIAIGQAGRVVVTYASRDEKYNGHAFIVRSSDDGKTFSDPQPITSDSPSQRFETAELDQDGRAFVAWIDKRNVAKAKKDGKDYAGAALAFAWDDRPGGTLQAATIARDNSCECCRIGVAFAGPGRPVVLFRNIFDGGIRDHAVITFADPKTPGPLYRVSDDDAKIDACPHQGPSLAIGPDGVYHATWFALGRKLKGLYYAHSNDGGKTFSEPMRLGDPNAQTSRPYVLATHGVVYLAYKSFDGAMTTIDLITSHDSGKTWSTPRSIAMTHDASDHPLLIASPAGAYLSWLTLQDGYRLIPLEPQS
ncbi:sialidase family protein [Hyphomicrobium sp.]|uniref:sialidase family protein n=1 Tax=Hyphomicrobium sp. TaxID=82 RepID=UPI001E060019|nr:sialidase family protein [Hyphomicrobium sp.]MBY0559509.1 glycoside hydrolase [Hyphomicrobium sp.]